MGHPRIDNILILFWFIRILQRGRPVEHRMLRSAVRILEIIARALELDGYSGLVLQESRLGIAFGKNQRLRIQEVLIVLVLRNLAHVSQCEELVIETELYFLGMGD